MHSANYRNSDDLSHSNRSRLSPIHVKSALILLLLVMISSCATKKPPAVAQRTPVIVTPAVIQPSAIAPKPPAVIPPQPAVVQPQPVVAPKPKVDSSFDKREMLNAHNAARARFGTPPLVWLDSAQDVAQQWADYLLLANKWEPRPEPRTYGENRYEGLGDIINSPKTSPSEVVAGWVGEEKDFNSATNTCRSGAVCGHFTQVVWKSTQKVGCAVARDARREVWVCNYYPPGNLRQVRPF
jgi:hypothetical protein